MMGWLGLGSCFFRKHLTRRAGGVAYCATYKLEAVEMSTMLRNPDDFGRMLDVSATLILKPAAADFIKRQRAQHPTPHKTTLNTWRVDVDLACMVHSRNHVLVKQRVAGLHLRVDSSPQGGRDFVIIEIDVAGHEMTSWPTSVYTRVLPPQCVGSRAGSAAAKLDRLRFTASLECSDLDMFYSSCRTILTDLGAQSNISQQPSKQCDTPRLVMSALRAPIVPLPRNGEQLLVCWDPHLERWRHADSATVRQSHTARRRRSWHASRESPSLLA